MGIYTLPLVSLVVAQVQNDDAFAAAKSGDLYNLRKLRQANWKENKPTATDGWKKTALHYAAEYDHADVADTMIGNAEVMAMKDYKGRTPLMLAAQKGNAKIVRNMAKQCKDNSGCNSVDDRERNALHYAADNGQFHIIRTLVGLFDPTNKDDEGRTALMLAVARNHVLAVKELLDVGPIRNSCLDIFDKEGMNIVQLAFRYGHLDVLNYISERLSSIRKTRKTKDSFDRNVFHLSAMSGNSETMLEYLLEENDVFGDNLNAYMTEDKHGDTPMHYIMRYGDLALFNAVRPKVDLKRLLSLKNHANETPVHCLLRLPSVGYAEIIENNKKYPSVKMALLINLFHDEDLDITWLNAFRTKDNLGFTPVLRAIEYGDFSAVREILRELQRHNAGSVNWQLKQINGFGNGAAQLLIDQHRMDALYQLFITFTKDGAKFDSLVDSDGNTPLLYAVKSGSNAAVELALRFESNVKQRSSDADDNKSPLMWALVGNRYSIAENLLKHGANPLASDSKGVSCLHYASGSGDNEVVNLVIHAISNTRKQNEKELQKGDITPRDNSKSSPLETAAYMNHADIVYNFINRYAKFEEGWETYANENGLLGKEYNAICKTPGFRLKSKFHRACQLAHHAKANHALEAFGSCCVDNDVSDDWTDEPVDLHEGDNWESDEWSADDADGDSWESEASWAVDGEDDWPNDESYDENADWSI